MAKFEKIGPFLIRLVLKNAPELKWNTFLKVCNIVDKKPLGTNSKRFFAFSENVK